MIKLTLDEIKSLHSRLILKTGGCPGLRDEGLLESAVYSAYAVYSNEEIYPTVEEKAARLMFALIRNHAFFDGNKRIAVLVMLITLQLNGIHLTFTQNELIALGLSSAEGKLGYEDILNWITNHKQ